MLKVTNQNKETEVKQQKNRIMTLESKVEMLQHVADMNIKEKNLLALEKEQAIKELLDVKKLNQVCKDVEKCADKTQHIIQLRKRPDLSQEEINNLLYQHLRLSLSNEEQLRQKLEKARADGEAKNQSLMLLKIDNEDLKKRVEKLKQKLKPDLCTKQPKQSEKNQAETQNLTRVKYAIQEPPTKKRKINEISQAQDEEVFISS